MVSTAFPGENIPSEEPSAAFVQRVLSLQLIGKIMQEWGYWTPFEAMRREASAHWGCLPPFMLYPEEIASGAAADDPPLAVSPDTALSRLNPDYAERYLQARANESVSSSDRFFEMVFANVCSPMQLDARYLHSQVCGKD